MIYSNFPTTLSKPNNCNYGHMGAQIVLGDDTVKRNCIRILCPTGLVVEKGLNPYLNFEFNKSATLTIKKYDEDWRNFDDPCWNIPNHLFLMLTSNILDSPRPLCKFGNGMLQTPEREVLSNFRMYARINYSVGRNKFWTFGIYKVLTKRPCIVKIIPPDFGPCKFLIIHDSQVSEYTEGKTELHTAIHALNISSGIFKEDWATL